MVNTQPNVLILGAGPAGSAMAIRLKQLGMQVTVAWNARSTRALTETLAAHAKQLLRGLGFDEDALAIYEPSPGVVSMWEQSELVESESIWNPYGDGLLIDRELLDEQLRLQAVHIGANLISPCVVSECRWDDATNRWSVDWQHAGHRVQRQFDWLIDATGRSAWLARRLGAIREDLDGLVGIVGRFCLSDGPDHRLYLEAQQNGWLYKLNSKRSVVIGVMTDADLVPPNRADMQRWWTHCVQASGQRAVLNSGAVSELRVMKANSSRLLIPGGHRWLAVGDAAAAWDPLSSQGLAQSLASAFRASSTVASSIVASSTVASSTVASSTVAASTVAASTVAASTVAASEVSDSDRAVEDYATWYKAEWENYWESYQHFYGQVQRWSDSTFWLRRKSKPGVGALHYMASVAN